MTTLEEGFTSRFCNKNENLLNLTFVYRVQTDLIQLKNALIGLKCNGKLDHILESAS